MKDIQAIAEALASARLQIEHLHEKFQETGSGAAVIDQIARAEEALKQFDGATLSISPENFVRAVQESFAMGRISLLFDKHDAEGVRQMPSVVGMDFVRKVFQYAEAASGEVHHADA